jgi:hypothetical protein
MDGRFYCSTLRFYVLVCFQCHKSRLIDALPLFFYKHSETVVQRRVQSQSIIVSSVFTCEQVI